MFEVLSISHFNTSAQDSFCQQNLSIYKNRVQYQFTYKIYQKRTRQYCQKQRKIAQTKQLIPTNGIYLKSETQNAPQMDPIPQTLLSRLFHLQTINQIDMWIQQAEGFPVFKKQDNIYRLKFYSLPQRRIEYEITVDTNIHFERNQNGIQWTQIKENEVMALSFKEDYGANAFWQLIEEYQRKYAITVPAAQGILFYFEYKVPDPTPNNLTDFLAQLQAIPQQQRHQRVVSIFLTKRDLLPKLISVFKIIDQQQNIPKLQLMFSIVKLIFNSSNQQLLYELMCNDSYMSILGALQYDPNFKNNRPKHRDFMRSQSRLLEVVPFNKNNQMLNLIIFTYRLEYVKQCILFPYLNDYSFTCTNYIIKGNYRKILNQIFNPKKKDFINSLFDLLRVQDVNAFKFLRQVFRIAKSIYANDVYGNIAERDFFDIMMKNLKEMAQNHAELREKKQKEKQKQKQKEQHNTLVNSSVGSTVTTSHNSISSFTLKTKKKKPQQIQQITTVCFEILEQFMQFEPQHFRAYCVSEKQKVMKYPTFNFLFEQFDNEEMEKKVVNTLKILVATQEPNDIKLLAHEKTVERILSAESPKKFMRWLQLFSKVVQPYNELISNKIEQIIEVFLNNLELVTKNDQIEMISTLKALVHAYINDEEKINTILKPRVKKIAEYLIFNRGAMGIRVSTYFAIFQPRKYGSLTVSVANELEKKVDEHPLLTKYMKLLKGLASRVEVELPSNLKRQKTLEPFKDEEEFGKMQKKVKTQ